MMGIGSTAVALAFAAPLSSQTAPPPRTAPPPACTTPQHRGFDFWVGEWTVARPDTNQQVAHSRIERMHDGCVIREQWIPNSGSGGSSLSHYDSARRTWRQLWLDSSGGRVEFEGGLVGDEMVLTGLWQGVNGPGQDSLVRMTYTRQSDGSVTQRGDASTDQGRTWVLSFLFVYRHEAATEVQP
ncbi:MAG: hypothetical protein AABZ45_04775 [Pseudomonadota bacterium]